jgi:hypothetical protein
MGGIGGELSTVGVTVVSNTSTWQPWLSTTAVFARPAMACTCEEPEAFEPKVAFRWSI